MTLKQDDHKQPHSDGWARMCLGHLNLHNQQNLMLAKTDPHNAAVTVIVAVTVRANMQIFGQ